MIETICAILLVLLQVYLVAEYCQSFGIFIVAAVLAPSLLFVRFNMPRSVLYLGIFALGFAFWAYCFYVPPQVVTDWVLPAKYLIAICGTLIVAQVLVLLSRSKQEKISPAFLGLALAGFLTCFCRQMTIENSVMFFVAAIGMGILLLFRPSTKDGAETKPTTDEDAGAFFRALVAMLAIVSILLGTQVIADTVRTSVGLVRYFVTDRVIDVTEAQHHRIGYSISGTYESVTRLKRTNPNDIAVMITCDVMPGYLRGRTFDRITRFGWKMRDRSIKSLPHDSSIPMGDIPIVSRQNPDYGLFEMVGHNRDAMELDRSQVRTLSIENNRDHFGDIFFTPLDTALVEAVGKQATIDLDGIIYGGVTSEKPYFAYVPRDGGSIPLSNEDLQRLVVVPFTLNARVGEVARNSAAGGQTDAERIALIESYFRSNYQYSLDANPFPQKDRLTYFILNRPPAHCEFFASAAAVFLRINGIPSRYVTGFGIHEASTSDESADDMWIGRNRDAHAWVEAFDRDKQQWVVVEATPGVNLPRTVWPDSDARIQLNGVTHRVLDGANDQRRKSWIAQAVEKMTEFRLLINLAIATLLGIVMVFVWIRSREQSSQSMHYADRKGSKRLRKFDRRLQKLHLSRRPNETLHQFAERLFDHPPDHDWIREAADEYRAYANRRYAV